MYIDLNLGKGLLIFAGMLFALLLILAAIGWAGYIRQLAENEALINENNSLRHVIRKYRRRENIRAANEYSKGVEEIYGPKA